MSTKKEALKTVLVTGAGSGIGFETARLLLENREYRLILIGKNREKLEQAAKDLATPDRLGIAACDLEDASQIRKTMEKITSGPHPLYALINNAGIYPFGGISDTTEKQWDEAMAVNLKAPFLLTQCALEQLSKSPSGGRIVNISSTAGLLPNHFALAYSVSKAALIHMTKTLAKELGKHNITVNCICPGIVRSPMHEAYSRNMAELEGFYEKKAQTFPIGRVGEPKDVASAVKFFLDPNSGWITGDVLVVDGGRLLL